MPTIINFFSRTGKGSEKREFSRGGIIQTEGFEEARRRSSFSMPTMKLELKKIKESPLSLLRRAGYVFQHGENKGEMSFVRSLARAGYPRFHIYAKLSGGDLTVSIHLDQKKETYGESNRHHGEYGNDGPLKEEVDRLRNILSS